MNCQKCGTTLNENAEFCSNCGASVNPFETNNPFVVPVPVEDKPFDKNSLPKEYRPLGAWSYFALKLLFSIPIVGFVFLIVFSFSKGNLNRRSFARSYWCDFIIYAILLGIAGVLFFILGIGFSDILSEAIFY